MLNQTCLDYVCNWFSVVLVWAAGEKGRSSLTGLSWMVLSQDFAHRIFDWFGQS